MATHGGSFWTPARFGFGKATYNKAKRVVEQNSPLPPPEKPADVIKSRANTILFPNKFSSTENGKTPHVFFPRPIF